ncbi:putative fatty acyl-CoA reductase CG5065 [Thrips palmi]|uniref:Fatty acyl-CoA reductase n=1 Tax=Thrips palmi TaxID=161013 RepID=A0A6P8YW90_THRPL|nr:putative fatty acyl-CoA reductase CG5065 [Thrips palmi]
MAPSRSSPAVVADMKADVQADPVLLPDVAGFYAGRDVLVTGATGFMGKVLVEKLLRCCPDVRSVYILVRPKHGTSTRARVEAMSRLPVFERLLKERPAAFEQLRPLEGDVGQEKLGLSEADQRTVLDNVSIVFHMAASLNFKLPLKQAVEDNTAGTKSVLDFCCQIAKLESFVYVSTAFCNCEQEVLEERVYRPKVDPHQVMRLCRESDPDTLQTLTKQLMGKHPNTYTFTKQLSEGLVDEYHTKMPLSIARPSIVTPALREPVPGWVDSLNGPTGIVIASGKGVLRSMMCDAQHHAEVVPVDVCINALILIAYKRTRLSQDEAKRTPVYNVSSNEKQRITWGEIIDLGREKIHEYPYDTVLWYPDGASRTNWLAHTLIVFFFQTLPAYAIDLLLTLAMQKTFMVRVQRKIAAGMSVLQYFTMRDWDFRNDRTWALWESLDRKDQEVFYINNTVPVDPQEYLKIIILGSRQYCCKEPLSTLPRARRVLRILYYVHHTCIALFYALCGWLLFRVLDSVLDSTLDPKSWAILGQVSPSGH